MNNADKPIHPLRGADGRLFSTNDGYLEQAPVAMGLTKREHFAVMAMLGLLSHDGNMRDAATEAVKQADALLKALEESK